MRLPDLEHESAFLGNWLAPEDLEPVICQQAARYYSRYAAQFVGDADDLEQVSRIAVWQLMQAKGEPEKVRELEAFGCIQTAIWQEIEQTKRTGPLMLSSQEVNWKAVACVDRNLSEHQVYVLDCFRNRVSQIVRKPCYEMMWLMLGCGWLPEEVTAWFRWKPYDKHRYPPSDVLKRIARGRKQLRLYLDREYEQELNQISFPWW